MGEITVNIHLENTLDRLIARTDKSRQVRSYEMEAVVDTGAVMLMLPQDVVEELELPVQRRATVRYARHSCGRGPRYGRNPRPIDGSGLSGRSPRK